MKFRHLLSSPEHGNVFQQNIVPIVERCMEQFKSGTGRRWKLLEYSGAAEAGCLIIDLAFSRDAVVKHRNNHGKKSGLRDVRFSGVVSAGHWIKMLPRSFRARVIAARIAMHIRSSVQNPTGMATHAAQLTGFIAPLPQWSFTTCHCLA
jgi:hypothetical protein